MSEQINNAISFTAFFVDTAALTGKEELTVTVDVRRGATVLVIDGATTELGGGLYEYTLASGAVDAEGLYTAVFKTTSIYVAQKHVPALWIVGKGGVENLDAAVSTRLADADAQARAQAALTAQGFTAARAAFLDTLDGLVANIWAHGTRSLTTFGTLVSDIWANATRTLSSYGTLIADIWDTTVPGTYAANKAGYKIGKIGTGSAVVVAPTITSERLVIIAGDDYLITDGRELAWTLTGVPDLSTATVNFVSAGLTKATTTTADTVTLELTAAETGAMTAGIHDFELAAELSGGSLITLVRGTLVVS